MSLHHSLIAVAFAAAVATMTASATPAPSLQLGHVPHWDEMPWRLAVPVAGDVVSFEGSDGRLVVEPSPVDGGSWIVFTGSEPGPVSGLLRTRIDGGAVSAVSVSGEVVAADSFDGLLLRGHRPGDRIERYLQPGASHVRRVDLAAARIATLTHDAPGWTRLVVQLPSGVGEADGHLVLDSGGESVPVPIPVHVSLLEAITVVGSTPLPSGFDARRIATVRERLDGARYSGRVGVLGVRAGVRQLRVLDAVSDGGTVFFNPLDVHDIAVGASADARVYLSGVRHLGGESTGERFLVLSPERASLVDPLGGVLARHQTPLLNRLGAARASRLNANRVFAVSGFGDGEWFLSSYRARRDDGSLDVRRVRYTPSLQGLLGPRMLRIGDLASIRYPTGRRFRENLLVSVGEDDGTLRIIELTRDGTTLRARPRYVLQGDPAGLRDVRLDVLSSPRARASGLPVRVRALVPRLEARILRVNEPGSWSFLARVPIGSTGVTSGVALATPRLLLGGPDGSGGTDLVRYSWNGEIPFARALGAVTGLDVRRYRASARRAHAWLLGRDTNGRSRVRIATNGLVRGTNLPPRVNAGPDVRTTESRVRLRAHFRDANGDPLGIRWTGSNVEFADRFARRTRAFVRPGRTQIFARVRENGLLGPGVALEAVDALVVRYDDAISVGGAASGLATALGAPEPNPAPAGTAVPFTLGARARARVDVFDVHGRWVRTLLDDTLSAGGYDAAWDGTRHDGAPAAGGVYFVRLVTGDRSHARRLVLVR